MLGSSRDNARPLPSDSARDVPPRLAIVIAVFRFIVPFFDLPLVMAFALERDDREARMH